MTIGGPVVAMENHSAALRAWAGDDSGARTAVHLDAHLDVGWHRDGDVRDLDLTSPAALLAAERDCVTHTREGVYDLSNWLGVALARGRLDRLFWVVPDELWFASARELRTFLIAQVRDVPLDDLLGLAERDGVYTFTCHGVAVSVCRLGDLPRFREPVLLDVDLDFFARYRAAPGSPSWAMPWVSPEAAWERLEQSVPRVATVTIAVSVNGGYLPEALRARIIREVHESLGRGPWAWAESEVGPEPGDLEGSPGYGAYLTCCAVLHRGLDAGTALSGAEAATAAAPDVGAYHYGRALSLSALNLTDDAVPAYERALECLGPDASAQVLNDYAGCLMGAGRLELAADVQRQALTLTPDSPVLVHNAALIAAGSGDWTTARRHAGRALSLHGSYLAALLTMSTACVKLDDPQTAAGYLATAARLAPNDAQAAYLRRRGERLGGS